MLIVGLTGGIGSGKSTVAKLFEAKGITIIDADKIARDVTEPGTSALYQIVSQFGTEILTPTQSLNRAKLRDLIFHDKNKRIWLENLLHPIIRSRINHDINLITSAYGIVVIPLLVETDPNPLINRILVIDTDEKNQITRTKERDQLSEDAIVTILKQQASRAERLAAADDVIHNEGGVDALIPQVEELHRHYLALARQQTTQKN